MKKLIIIGAGGFGREVLQYSKDILKAKNDCDWEIGGFLDDNLKALENYKEEYGVIGTIYEHNVACNNLYICAIGNPVVKLGICGDFMKNGAIFTNIIHPTAYIGERCNIGVGNVICPHAVLTTDVIVGDHVAINCHANCGHDSIVDSGCTVSPFCDITGFAHLERGAFMGSHASVCPSVRVGEFSKLGAGAIAISDVDSHCTAVGVPARIIKTDD